MNGMFGWTGNLSKLADILAINAGMALSKGVYVISLLTFYFLIAE